MIYFRLIVIGLCGYCTVVATNSNSAYYFAMAEDDKYRIVKDKSMLIPSRGGHTIPKLFYCKTGLYYPLLDDYCSRNPSLVEIEKNPHSYLYYNIPFSKDIKYLESLEKPQQKYFQLHVAFLPQDNDPFNLSVNLIPNKREASLYYSKYPKKDWNIFTDPMVNKVNCQMFSYGGEYKIPVPAKKGKLIIDIYPNECKDDANRNKYTVFVNFEPDETYELKMTQDLERSKKANEPIFDISLLMIPKEVEIQNSEEETNK